MSYSQCGNSTAGYEQGKNPAASDTRECVLTGPFSRVGLEQHLVGSFFILPCTRTSCRHLL